MRYLKLSILTIALLFTTTGYIHAAEKLLKVEGSGFTQSDIDTIQEMILRLTMGFQQQKPYFVYMYFREDPAGNGSGNAELESLKTTLGSLFETMTSRTRMSKPYADMTNTFDFTVRQRALNFSPDGMVVTLDLEVGFYSLPGDLAVISELPAERVNSMSETEKNNRSKFRTARLVLKKIEGAWYITSFRGLDETLKKLCSHYLDVETTGSGKRK